MATGAAPRSEAPGGVQVTTPRVMTRYTTKAPARCVEGCEESVWQRRSVVRPPLVRSYCVVESMAMARPRVARMRLRPMVASWHQPKIPRLPCSPAMLASLATVRATDRQRRLQPRSRDWWQKIAMPLVRGFVVAAASEPCPRSGDDEGDVEQRAIVRERMASTRRCTTVRRAATC